ncbi:MAG: hypothetical protein CVT72_03645 [Alphaproteobacteria bacterium HGW-Alphaproteobacteria-11]|nr:MAG: hypothetical protein CVT72_03645 [Alphaproteobacteria bacterium HGW-Alphaproteobacteria-11]
MCVRLNRKGQSNFGGTPRAAAMSPERKAIVGLVMEMKRGVARKTSLANAHRAEHQIGMARHLEESIAADVEFLDALRGALA